MKKFLSIDIETTGLNEENCQILEFGAVVGDWTTPLDELPCFKLRFKYEQLRGEPYALMLNAGLISDMARRVGEWYPLNELVCRFSQWLTSQAYTLWHPGKKITITGKNIGSFDRRFLAKVTGWDWNLYSHRYLDPGSLFFRPDSDEILPDLPTCAERAGVDLKDFVLHDAVDDARLVVHILRMYYKGRV